MPYSVTKPFLAVCVLLLVDRGLLELAASLRAGRRQVLATIEIPAALPSIFLGLRNSAGLSVIGAIVGDQFFQRGTPGIGVAIQIYASRLSGPELYAAILTAAATVAEVAGFVPDLMDRSKLGGVRFVGAVAEPAVERG